MVLFGSNDSSSTRVACYFSPGPMLTHARKFQPVVALAVRGRTRVALPQVDLRRWGKTPPS
eukprot:2210617-Rhodomonas_salina.1